MKYVKGISLFFVYPVCCILLGFAAGNSWEWDAKLIKTTEKSAFSKENNSDMQHLSEENLSSDMKEDCIGLSEFHGNESVDKQQFVMNLHAVNEDETDIESQLQNGYYVGLENGLVIVYHGDMETVFLYTDISAEELPLEVQEDLATRIYMKDEGALYDFLENYTS